MPHVRCLLLMCTAAILVSRDAVVFAKAEPSRAPRPEVQAVEAACGDVHDTLREEVQATRDSGDGRGFVVALKEYARQSKDPVRKFALLEVAEQLAIELHQYSLAMGVAAEKVLQFDVTDMPTRMRIIESITPSKRLDELDYGIEFATSGLAVAVGTEDFEAAKKILEDLRTMVASYGAIEKAEEMEIRRKYPKMVQSTLLHDKLKANSIKQAWDKVFLHRRRDRYEAELAAIEAAATVVAGRREAMEKWTKRPGDAAAATVVGRYECFDHYDWDQGLRLLAQGEGPLAEVARDEIATGSTAEAADAAALADRWWRVAAEAATAEGGLPNDTAAIQSHAAELYLKALPELPEGFEKEVARKRIRQAAAPRVLYAVESDAARCDTAAEAVRSYRVFLAEDSISEPMRRAGEVRMQRWKLLADKGYLRFGEEWVDPPQHAERLRQADASYNHAAALIGLGQLTLAKEEFDRVSRLEPTRGRADYAIGFMNVIYFDNVQVATYFFREAARREPSNGYIVTGLANCEMLLDKPGIALLHYLQAIIVNPDEFVVGNLGVALQSATGEDQVTRKLSALYRVASQMLQVKPTESANFLWRKPFAIYQGDASQKPGSQDGRRTTDEEVQIGSGTGFVVAPHLVLTNRHVVEGCTKIEIVDPKNRDKQLTAKVIASSEDPDLALLECEGLEAPAVTLAAQLPPRGEDIMCLGFPGGSLLGLALKSTKGSVISPGDEGLDGGNFLHSCIINPGNSGGPIVDQMGRLVGVVVAIMKTNAIGNAYSIGIPVERVRPFLDAEIKKYEESKQNPNDPNLAADPVDGATGDKSEAATAETLPVKPPKPEPVPNRPITWAEVDAQVSPSTVFIVGTRRSTVTDSPESPADQPSQGDN